MFSNKMDFSSCVIWIDFHKSGHNYDVQRRFNYHIVQNFGWEKLRLTRPTCNDLDKSIIK